MGYIIYAAGVYAGLWMRKYDQDTGRVTEMVANARNIRSDMWDTFTERFFGWEKPKIAPGSIVIKQPSAIQ